MADTLLSNLINPKVFADAVSAKLGSNIKLYPITYVQDLSGQAGGIISVPKYGYIGDATSFADGSAITPVALSQTTEDLTVQQYGTAVSITDMAAKNAYGDPLAEAERQVTKSIANAIDAQLFAKLNAIDGTNGTLLHTAQAGQTAMSVTVLADALSKFGEDQDGQKYLIVNPTDLANIRKDSNFILKGSDVVDAAGEIFGCTVMVSERVPTKVAYLYKPNALGLYLKKDVQVEVDRDILKKMTVISADVQFACHLRDVKGAVKIQLAAS